METYKIEITIDNLDFASYTGIMSTLKNMIENSKHEIKVCDGKNADTSDGQLTIPPVIKLVCPNCWEEHTETDCGGYCTAACLQGY